MSEYRKLLKDSGIFAIGSLGSKIVTFLFVPLYTYCLTTEEYGIADLITITSNLLFPVFTISISEAVLRFCYLKEVDRSSILSTLLKFNLYASLINIIVALLVSFILESFRPYLLYYLAIFSLSSLEVGLANFLKGSERIKEFAIQGVIHTIVFVCSNLLFLLVFKLGLSGFLLSTIIACLITILYMIWCIDFKSYTLSIKLDKGLVREMLRYSFPLVPAGMAWWINISADKFMISGMLSVADNGIYSVAHKIPTLLTTITAFFTSAWQISAMKNFGNNNYSTLFGNVLKSVNCLLEIGCAAIIVSSQLLSSLLFQKDFYIAWQYVPLLTISACFSVIAGTLASAYTASKRTKILLISTCFGALVNIVFNYLLIRELGILGAAISTCCSFLVMVIIRYFIMNNHLVKINVNIWKDVISFTLLFSEGIFIVYRPELIYWISIISLVIIFGLNIPFLLHFCKSIKHL